METDDTLNYDCGDARETPDEQPRDPLKDPLKKCPAFAAALVLCAGMLLFGCSSTPDGSAPSSGEAVADAAPQDSVRVDGITYHRGDYGQTSTIPAKLVDRQTLVGRVREQVASYEPEEGQATELRPGTPLYAVRGYDPSFRITAKEARKGEDDESGGAWALYEVQSNPGAEGAGDLLGIQGKAGRISLETIATNEGEPVRQENFILGPEDSARVAGAALDAPLRHVAGEYFKGLLVFELEDGTRSFRVYDPYSGELFLSENPYEESVIDVGVVLPTKYRKLLVTDSRR